MRKIILMMLLAFVSSSAIAEWIKVGGSELFTPYIYLNTINNKVNKAKMWEMYDNNKPRENSKPFMSEMAQYEYDCNTVQRRKIVSTFYSGNMGSGELLHTETYNDAFKPISPGMQDSLWQLACVPVPTKWEPAMYNKGNTQITYVNAASIRKVNEKAIMWSLTDLKTAGYMGQKSYMSQIDRREYNCKAGQMRLLFASLHAGNMGVGALVDAEVHPQDWIPVATGSTGEALWKIACGILKPR